MEKTLHLGLKDFTSIPLSLIGKNPNIPKAKIGVDLGRLYHHFFLDTFGHAPPDPNPTQHEYLNFLMNTPEFRFKGDGVGSSTLAKRNVSSFLGQAFCRYVLHDHLGIYYFAHMDKILNKEPNILGTKYSVKRVSEGDVPDYFCTDGYGRVFLAEAKGTYESVNFTTQKFQDWRDQFKRVLVCNELGKPVSIKGFIVATRFATENKPTVEPRISVEDPETDGDKNLLEGIAGALQNKIIDIHYSEIATKLRQPILATALENNYPISAGVSAAVWRLKSGPDAGVEFVGGYYSEYEDRGFYRAHQGENYYYRANNPFRLDEPTRTFFGIERKKFEAMVHRARGDNYPHEILRRPPFQKFYEAVSTLGDGSILGPLDFFDPLGSRLF